MKKFLGLLVLMDQVGKTISKTTGQQTQPSMFPQTMNTNPSEET